MDNALARDLTSTIEPISPLTDPRWSTLTETHGSIFASPPWLRALNATYGFAIEGWLQADDRGRPVGGIPAARLAYGDGERLIALPFSDFCNPIDIDGSSWPLLADILIAQGVPIEVRCLDGAEPVEDDRFTRVFADLWHAVDLDPDEDRSWESLAGSARRAIRKARGAGIEIRAGSDRRSLRAFYDLHLGVRKHKYRLLPQPFAFFESLQETFGDRLVVLGAWRGDDLIAGVIYLAWGETFYYKFNASSESELVARPNDLLMWEGMRYAVSCGLKVVDLGRTDADHESLARYKAKYATREGRITVVRRGEFRRDPTLGSVLGPLTELLTRPDVPDEVTEAAAEAMYRHFA